MVGATPDELLVPPQALGLLPGGTTLECPLRVLWLRVDLEVRCTRQCEMCLDPGSAG